MITLSTTPPPFASVYVTFFVPSALVRTSRISKSPSTVASDASFSRNAALTSAMSRTSATSLPGRYIQLNTCVARDGFSPISASHRSRSAYRIPLSDTFARARSPPPPVSPPASVATLLGTSPTGECARADGRRSASATAAPRRDASSRSISAESAAAVEIDARRRPTGRRSRSAPREVSIAWRRRTALATTPFARTSAAAVAFMTTRARASRGVRRGGNADASEDASRGFRVRLSNFYR